MEPDKTKGEWRCRCKPDPVFDKSINPSHVKRCAACGTDRPLVDEARRQHVLNTADDLMSRFLYYDRKEDEDLPVGEIERACIAGDVTVDEIVNKWAGAMWMAVQEARKP